MDTKGLMQLALDLVGFERIPEDSTIYVPGKGIKRVLFGLDIGTAELLMAHQQGYDAVIAHHPVGVPHKDWPVFGRHVEFLVQAGVPEQAARAAVAPKLESLRLGGITRNYEQVPMAARHLGMPFLNIHCPLDEMGRRIMQTTVDNLLEDRPDATLAEVIAALAALPAAQRAEIPPQVVLGHPGTRAGRVVVAHGALTNGGYDVARAYFEHGIDTVIYIHIAPADLARLRGHEDGQLIVIGHLLGDAYGIEPYIDALRARGVQVDVLSEVLARPA
jgi:hypothetical protein